MAGPDNRHIIKKQILQVEVEGEERARQTQETLGRIFYDKLYPLIKRALDEHSPPNVLHRLTRLEIDLGEVPLADLTGAIEQKFRLQFEKELTRALKKAETEESSSGTRWGRSAPQPGTSVDRPEEPVNGPEAKSTGRSPFQNRSQAELFVYFLETGRLPWWAKPSPDLLSTTVTELLSGRPDWLREQLGASLRRIAGQTRLIEHLPDRLLIRLTELWTILGWQDASAAWLEKLSKNTPELAIRWNRPRAQVRYACWEIVFSSLISGTGDATFSLMFGPVMERQLAVRLSLNPEQVRAEFRKTGMEIEKPQELSSSHEERRLPEDPPNVGSDKKFSHSDKIYIDNAGLVLPWVFFNRFFENLEWLSDGAFRDPLFQQRAVWMLQYLVDQNASSPEYLLPLNKLLCGLPLEGPLEAQDPLTETEQAAGDELIEAILANASALGHLSIEGFRQSFLRREGVLTYSDNRWLLQVRKETFDILLGRLPWSYQVVKLPWMTTAIFVEW